MTRPRTTFRFISTLAVVSMLGGGGGANAAAPTEEMAQTNPDPASVFEGPKVDDASDAKTGGSFGEPGMRQRAERTPMRAFGEVFRSLAQPSATIGGTTHITPESARLTDEQLAAAARIQRGHQAASMRAAREAGISVDDLRTLRDEHADPEARRAMLERIEAATPDPAAAQEKMLALLTEEQRTVVEDRLELWRAERYEKARGDALERQAEERAAQQEQRRAQNPRELARLARALGVSESTAAKALDAISGPPTPGEEGLSRQELAERRIHDIPDDVLNARQKDRLKQLAKRRLEREGAPGRG